MEAPAGFEPANAGFAVPCLTNLATVPCLEGHAGIAEPDWRQGPPVWRAEKRATRPFGPTAQPARPHQDSAFKPGPTGRHGPPTSAESVPEVPVTTSRRRSR